MRTGSSSPSRRTAPRRSMQPPGSSRGSTRSSAPRPGSATAAGVATVLATWFDPDTGAAVTDSLRVRYAASDTGDIGSGNQGGGLFSVPPSAAEVQAKNKIAAAVNDADRNHQPVDQCQVN